MLTALGAAIGANQTVAGFGHGADALIGGVAGATIGLALVLGVRWGRRASPTSLAGGIISFFLAAWLAAQFLGFLDIEAPIYPLIWLGLVGGAGVAAARIGAALGASFGGGGFWGRSEAEALPKKEFKLLDTSVIIDGRIADICETGFMEGVLLIPQFVLQELQYIADSFDSTKRTRGRRGLDILKRIQKQTNVAVEFYNKEMPKAKDVDSKLVVLAKEIGAKVLSNDFNLNKVAELQGVIVLNINQLANALKPVVLPGETMSVHVMKEGKEAGQGIGYLDDGTMVVIDNAKRFLGRS
ncbi:MAG: PIN/TRAM domain-containing protein, partial [Vicinamibacteria bacterium]